MLSREKDSLLKEDSKSDGMVRRLFNDKNVAKRHKRVSMTSLVFDFYFCILKILVMNEYQILYLFFNKDLIFYVE